MRSAVMKVGQMLSMDGLGVLPATQLAEVLEREYGNGWHRRFKQFSFAADHGCMTAVDVGPFGPNVPAAQRTRSTSNRCRAGATSSETSSPSHFPSMARPNGASPLMT